ncbi:MAG: PLP-dependent aminotransferase family protein [Clostridia bacterium]|nr:PLP-dependent aminotransferase family protein [Clostridia bacterium]
MKPIDFSSSTPAYMQLYQSFRDDIISGIYPYGTKLPSKRMAAEQSGVSVITVEHAYGILCDEGYLQSRCRSGYFVVYRLQESFSVPLSQPVPFPTSPTVVSEDALSFSTLAKAYRRVLAEYGDRLLCRCPNTGCEELRRALSAYLARSRGIIVSPEQIVIGSGSEYLYGLVVQLLGRTRRYGVEHPSYEKILEVYRANGASCDRLTMGKDGILSSELSRTDASVLHITPFNSYPTGVTASASKRHEYIRWANSRDGIIVEDDFDSEFTMSSKAEETVFSLDPRRVIYMNTFSRTVAPSIRVGYMILPEQFVGLFGETLGKFSCTVPVFEQYLLAELIANGDFERHINRVRRKRRKQK